MGEGHAVRNGKREDISIIVPAFNAERTLPDCIEGCLDQTCPPMDLIVVDDGSTDGTPRVAERYPVHYLQQQNHGPASARNAGAAAARGSILAFTDADCRPRRDWIERLLAALGEDGVAVGGTYAIANSGNLLARLIQEEIALRHDRFGDRVDFIGSFNFAVRREAFETAGGFDENFSQASAEDNDLAYRLAARGGVLKFARDAVVAHQHPDSLSPYLRTQYRHGYWRVKLYCKHPERVQRGDQYANRGDFLGPPLAVLLMTAAIPIVLLPVAWTVSGAGAWIGFAALHIALHLPRTLHMVRQTGRLESSLYLPLAMLRDGARGLGLVSGLFRFGIPRGGARA